MAENEPERLPIHRSSLPEARTLADLHGVAQDLETTLSILHRLVGGENDDLLKKALFSAALITYRRCFNTGVRNGLSKSDVTNHTDDGGLHEHLRAMADKLVAHSVNPFERTEVGVVVVDGAPQFVGALSSRLVSFGQDGLRQWGQLTVQIMERVVKPRIAAAESALLSATRRIPIEDVIKAPTIGYVAPGPEQASKSRD